MKKFTFQIFAILAFAFSWQAHAQDTCATAVALTPGTAQAGATTTGAGSFSDSNTAPNVNPCSGNYNDLEYWFQYTAGTTGETLDITVSDLTSNWYGVFVIDNCPDSTPTCIVQDTNGGSMPDLTVTTPSLTAGTTYYIVLSDYIEGPTSFTMNSVLNAAPTCTPVVVDSSTVVDDCGTSQFSVDVLVSDLGDGTVLTDGLGGSFPITAGTVTVGPYTNGDTITLTVEHSDGACDFELGNFESGCTLPGEICENSIIIGSLPYSTTDNTSNYGDDYAGSPGSSSTCGTSSSYLNGDDVVYAYTATSDTSINVSMLPTGTWSGIFVYTNCADIGTACVAGMGSSSSAIRTFDLDVINGTTYYFVISTFASPQSVGYTLNISENTCTPATATYAVINDCDVSGGFLVEVDVTDLGTATALTISDDQGNASQALTAIGTLTFGPYVNGDDVVMTIDDDNDDDSCTITSSALTQAACPPINDDCSGAISLVVGSDLSCSSPVSGSTIAATQSLPGCLGSATDDVWYSFTAASTLHAIIINNTSGASDIVTEVFDACGGTSLVCQDTPNSPVNVGGLTIGETYFFRIYTYTSTQSTRTSFEVCVGTPPAPPVNDLCSGALPILVSTDSSCNNVVSGTTESATASTANCTGGRDVWYSFVAPETGDFIFSETETFDSGFTSTYISAYEGVCGTLTQVGSSSSCFYSGDLTLSAVAGTTYYINIRSSSPTNYVEFDLCVILVPEPQSNQTCATADTLVCGDSITGATIGSTGTFEDIGCSIGNNGVWYTFTGDGGDMTVTVEASFDHEIGIASGACGSLVNIDCVDDSTAQESYTITNTVDGEIYYVYIAYYSSGSSVTGTYKIMLACESLTSDEFDRTDVFTYYPNPVTNVLNIKAQNNMSTVAVYNMLGQEVLRTAPNTAASMIDMSNLQTGAYFVKVTIGNTTETIRVIKN